MTNTFCSMFTVSHIFEVFSWMSYHRTARNLPFSAVVILTFLLIINCKKIDNNFTSHRTNRDRNQLHWDPFKPKKHHFKVCGILFAANFYLSDWQTYALLTSEKSCCCGVELFSVLFNETKLTISIFGLVRQKGVEKYLFRGRIGKKTFVESSNGLISEIDNTERKFYFLEMYQQNLAVIFTYFASAKILHDHNSSTYHIQDFFSLCTLA